MILINDLSRHCAAYRELIQKAVARVLDRAWFVLGPECEAFEARFASYIGTRFCRGVGNGTDALEIALRAVGVTANAKVATVANAGFYASTALSLIGAAPVYMDVDLDTQLVQLDEVRRALSAGAKAVVVTHLYGRAVPEIGQLAQLCREANIPLIEDCAQAHGARVNNKCVGSFGDIGCFSFYPTKNLGAIGDGGALATNNPDLAQAVSQLRQYGWTSKYHVDRAHGRNSRLDELQSAVLLEFLPLLDEWNARRRHIAALYVSGIANPNIKLPLGAAGEAYVAHLFVVRAVQRDRLRTYLKEAGIASDIHYPVPDHMQGALSGAAPAKLPNTELLAAEILTLPCYPHLTDAEVAQVIATLNAWKP